MHVHVCNTHGHRCDTHGYRCIFVLLLMLLVQLNCGLQFLENKILFVSLASAINIRDNLPIELDTPSIDIFAVLLDVASRPWLIFKPSNFKCFNL